MEPKIELIQQLANEMIGATVRLFEGGEWAVCTFTKVCLMRYDQNDINADQDTEFRDACHNFNPETDRFLDITLTIAHEMGHWMTREVYNKITEMRKYDEEVEKSTPQSYPYIAAERAATIWGIEWILSHPSIVSQFETAWRCA